MLLPYPQDSFLGANPRADNTRGMASLHLQPEGTAVGGSGDVFMQKSEGLRGFFGFQSKAQVGTHTVRDASSPQWAAKR